MLKEVNQIYNVKISNLGDIFTHLIQEEETRRGTYRKKGLIKRKKKTNRAPPMKYQSRFMEYTSAAYQLKQPKKAHN